jgi:hypothetical protein
MEGICELEHKDRQLFYHQVNNFCLVKKQHIDPNKDPSFTGSYFHFYKNHLSCCWTIMRTRTKRTRGTENPNAFIRLNMQIVRVAHFSFITQVERQVCIVNQGYTIVTKQQ